MLSFLQNQWVVQIGSGLILLIIPAIFGYIKRELLKTIISNHLQRPLKALRTLPTLFSGFLKIPPKKTNTKLPRSLKAKVFGTFVVFIIVIIMLFVGISGKLFNNGSSIVTLSFDSNGGSMASPEAITVDFGYTITMPSYSGTKSGYTFGGWRWVEEDGTYYDYKTGETYNWNFGSGTLYALWLASVSFDSNGGGSVAAPETKTAVFGYTITMPSYSGTKLGYTFGGWRWVDENDMYYDYEAGKSYNWNSGSGTFYALWLASVSFDCNGGSIAAPETKTAVFGYTITMPSYSGIKSGYTFGGWRWVDGNGTYYDYEAGKTYDWNLGSGTLYARWIATVSFDCNGGGSVAAPEAITVDSGYTITMPSYGGTKSGYTFGGWRWVDGNGAYYDYEAGKTYDWNFGSGTLYARWIANY